MLRPGLFVMLQRYAQRPAVVRVSGVWRRDIWHGREVHDRVCPSCVRLFRAGDVHAIHHRELRGWQLVLPGI